MRSSPVIPRPEGRARLRSSPRESRPGLPRPGCGRRAWRVTRPRAWIPATRARREGASRAPMPTTGLVTVHNDISPPAPRRGSAASGVAAGCRPVGVGLACEGPGLTGECCALGRSHRRRSGLSTSSMTRETRRSRSCSADSGPGKSASCAGVSLSTRPLAATPSRRAGVRRRSRSWVRRSRATSKIA